MHIARSIDGVRAAAIRNLPLNRLEQEYASRFVRVHRSCMVARDAITGFERVSDEGEGHWVVVLDGGSERLPFSRRQQHIVREFGRG